MGTLITFYSYKGGVGRTMALANIGTLLASWGKRVLLVDWDLEAPGIEYFFFKGGAKISEIRAEKGLINLLTDLSCGRTGTDPDCWTKLLIDASSGKMENPVKILTSGSRSQGYFRNVRQLDVKDFYENRDGGSIIEQLRMSWKSQFDFVLVDSRTGITDIGGICTIQLPDILAIVFAATEQSLTGAVEVAAKASIERQKLPFDRSVVPVLPIPSRFDTQTEQKIARDWLARFEESLSPLYNVWLPKDIPRRAFLELTKIPYAPYFSFGEGLPAVEQGTTDPASLGFAYETVAALVANRLQNADILVSNRDEFVRLARIRARLPKTSLRELPWDVVVFIDLVGSGTLRSLLETPTATSKTFEEILERYQSIVADAAELEGGVVAMSDGYSFLIAFPAVANAVRCALSVQESLVVERPIIQEPLGQVKARIAVHSSSQAPSKGIAALLKGASKIVSRAQADQILISEGAYNALDPKLEGVEFRPRNETIELDLGNVVHEEELWGVEKILSVTLNPQELAALAKQNPDSKSAGGFQAFLVGLQGRINAETHELRLGLTDRERIARYAHAYKGGGWQGRLRKIFGRTLGNNLGRR
jgi:MinD-like ATPase involved in chromosome partitioning or flagellar assembly